MESKILVVDDEREMADLVGLYLENEGFQVFKFYSAMGALACAGTEGPGNLRLSVKNPPATVFSKASLNVISVRLPRRYLSST